MSSASSPYSSSSSSNGPLQPGEQPPVSCKLSPEYREGKLDYQALSYTWGSTNDKVPIRVNGEDVLVTRNLRTALQHIRDENEDVTLWIDALSINQADDDEKSAQVAKMRDVYAEALNTRVWLGPASEDSDAVLAELNRLGERVVKEGLVEIMLESGRLKRNWDDKNAERFQELEEMKEARLAGLFKEAVDNLALTASFLISFGKLLSREYWKRVWILQELVVSSRIIFQCGTATINIDRLYACMMYIPRMKSYATHKLFQQIYHPATEEESSDEKKAFLQAQWDGVVVERLNTSTIGIFGTRLRYQQSLADSVEGPSLIQLLAKLNVIAASKVYSNATDDRDRIFALLGIATEGHGIATEGHGIVPEYDRRISCSDIYTKAAHAIIKSGEIDLLSFSQHKDRPDDLPSWVPDWRSKRILQPSGRMPWNTAFNACPSHPEHALSEALTDSKPPAPGSLMLNGYQVDVIDTLGWPWTPRYFEGCTNDTPANAMYLLDIANLCTESEIKVYKSGVEIYTDDTDRRNAHICIPVADQEENGGIFQRPTEVTRRGYDEVMQDVVIASTHALNRHDNPGVLRNSTPNTPSNTAYFNMMGWQRDRRPFLSEKGYVGLAPVHVEVGDMLVLFSGAKFPYVVRKKDNATYTFVGEAYVHGIMYGEFMKGEMKATSFTLV